MTRFESQRDATTRREWLAKIQGQETGAQAQGKEAQGQPRSSQTQAHRLYSVHAGGLSFRQNGIS